VLAAVVGEEPANGAGRARVAGLGRDLAVADDVSGSQAVEHDDDRSLEVRHVRDYAVHGRPFVTQPGDELVEVVDRDGTVVEVVTRAAMRAGNLRHRCAYVVVRSGGRVLAHRRAAWKDVWPSRWDLAFGGVLAAGEAWADGAVRELAEEAGVATEPSALTDLGPLAYESDLVKVVGRVYAVESEGPFTFADGEVAAIEWVAVDELDGWLRDHPLCLDTMAGVVPLIR
jgi:isopentenyldiphosphate isomerase